MTSALLALPAALDQPDGHTIGAKGAMALMALVAIVLFVLMAVVGAARARRKPPAEPVYPILDPPAGRDDASADPRR